MILEREYLQYAPMTARRPELRQSGSKGVKGDNGTASANGGRRLVRRLVYHLVFKLRFQSQNIRRACFHEWFLNRNIRITGVRVCGVWAQKKNI